METDSNVCIVCNKGGEEVWLCNGSECSVAVHEDCLGVPTYYDSTWKFHCPFCAHQYALEEVDEAQKDGGEEAKKEAQQKIYFSQWDLAKFIARADRALEVNASVADKGEVGVSGSKNGGGEHVQNVGIGESPGGESLIGENDQGDDQHMPSTERSVGHDVAQETMDDVEMSSKQDDQNNSMEEVLATGESLIGENDQGDDQHMPSTERSVEHDAAQERKEDAELSSKQDDQNDSVEVVPVTVATEPNLVDSGETSGHERRKRKQPEQPLVEDAITVQDQHNTHTGRPVKPQKLAKHPSKLMLPKSRSRIPFSYEEEKMLKKAVPMCQEPGKKLSWEMIFEYGKDVFEPSRTSTHLREKWKRMEKVGPTGRKR